MEEFAKSIQVPSSTQQGTRCPVKASPYTKTLEIASDGEVWPHMDTMDHSVHFNPCLTLPKLKQWQNLKIDHALIGAPIIHNVILTALSIESLLNPNSQSEI